MDTNNLSYIRKILCSSILDLAILEHCRDSWTKYCFTVDLEVDTKLYDDLMLDLWTFTKDKRLFYHYEHFYNFMSSKLV